MLLHSAHGRCVIKVGRLERMPPVVISHSCDAKAPIAAATSVTSSGAPCTTTPISESRMVQAAGTSL